MRNMESFHCLVRLYNAALNNSDYSDAYAKEDFRTVKAALSQQPESAEPEQWGDYDPVHLNGYGGGDISWWQDYIRSEVDRANEFWREQVSTLYATPPPAAVPEYLPLDYERLAVFDAIRAIRIGNQTDDKLIVANLHKAGHCIAKVADAAPQPPKENKE